MSAEPALSVVVPLYNEAGNVETFAENLYLALKDSVPEHEIVLVDNGSSDATGALIADCAQRFPTVRTVSVPVNRGYGWGIINGLRAARGRVIGWVDGDNEVPPETAPAAYRELTRRGLDLICGEVIPAGRSLRRRLVSAIFLGTFNLLFLSRYRSINGKPKLFRRECLKKLAPAARDWFIDAEIMIKARRAGLRTGFLPFRLNPRRGGESNVRARTALEFVANLLRARIRGLENGEFP